VHIIALVLGSSQPLAANWHDLVVSESGGNERHASVIKKMGEVGLQGDMSANMTMRATHNALILVLIW